MSALVFAVLSVFVAGLMVGRTPEFLGKKIEAREITRAVLTVVILQMVIFGLTALAAVLPVASAGPNNAGPHGLSELSYACSSATGNTGSAFAGLSANTLWYNLTLGTAMVLGRFAYVIPVLAMAGSLAAKTRAAPPAGTLPTDGPLFVGLLAGVILILGGLQFFPALALGPVVEHVLMLAGKTFQEMTMSTPAPSTPASPALFDRAILLVAARDAVLKLNPRSLMRNPVIFVTEVVALPVTFLWLRDLLQGTGSPLFSGQIAIWLWFTVLFATIAEAVTEGRGKAQAASLRQSRSDVQAKLLLHPEASDNLYDRTNALNLSLGDVVLVETGEVIPLDGEIIQGVAAINEAAITGESAPLIREAGGDRSAVTGSTTVLSDWIKVRVTAAPGTTYIDRMIALVEGAARDREAE